jgi:GAF domain-containing protein
MVHSVDRKGRPGRRPPTCRHRATLEAVREITALVLSEAGTDAAISAVVRWSRLLVPARVVALALYRPEGGLWVAAADGDGADSLGTDPLPLGDSLFGAALDAGAVVRTSGETSPSPGPLGAGSALAAPIVVAEEPAGLVAYARRGRQRPFTTEDAIVASVLAQQAALALGWATLAGRATTLPAGEVARDPSRSTFDPGPQ